MCQNAGAANTGNRTISPALQRHFDKENARIKAFMDAPLNGKNARSIETTDGITFERYTQKEMLDIIKENISNGTVYDDNYFSILYNDGNIEWYGAGDDISKAKTSGIKGVIWDNGSTYGYSGTGQKIENYNETAAFEKNTRYGTSKSEDDWRIDWSDAVNDYYKFWKRKSKR